MDPSVARLQWNLHCNIAATLRASPGSLVHGSEAIVDNQLKAAFHSNQTGSIIMQTWEPDLGATLGLVTSDPKKTIFVNTPTQVTHSDLEIVDFSKGGPGDTARHALHSGALTPFSGHVAVEETDKFAFSKDMVIWKFHPLRAFMDLVGEKPFPFSFLYGWLHGRLAFDNVCGEDCRRLLDHFNSYFTYYMFIGLIHRTGPGAESRPKPLILLPRTLCLPS